MFTFPITFLTEAASVFLPADPPGAPFADYNAQSLTVGSVTTWANEGSDATGDLTVPGGANAPECIAAGAGSPVTGAKYVRFDRANSEALQGALTTARLNGTISAFVAVVRVKSTPSAADYVFDGDDVSSRCACYVDGNNGDSWRMLGNGATASNGNAACEIGKWVRVVGRFTADGRLSVERAERGDPNSYAGSDLDGLTVGSSYTLAQFIDMDLARLTLWDDGTTMEAAERWVEAAYPFAAVPPGNPDIWLDPNDQPIGSISAITDKGSRGVDPTTVADMSIVADTDCPEQQVFSFNGTTSAIRWAGGSFTSIDLSTTNALFATCARSTQDSVQDAIFGDNGAPTWYCRYANTNAMVRNFGSAQTGDDFDTLAPFNTRLRWANVQFLEVAGASGGGTYIDGNLSATSSAGTNNLASMSIGVQGISWFTGRMADILVYVGANEANAQRAAEVEQWLQRHRRLATQPGAPQLDLDANALVLTEGDPVGTWTNDGSGGDLTATSNLRPTYHDNDGPEPSLLPGEAAHGDARVTFDGFDDKMDEATRADLTQPLAAAWVCRMPTLPAPAAAFPIIHSITGTSACNVVFYNATTWTIPRVNAGGNLDESGATALAGEWYAGAVEWNNTTSHNWWTQSPTSTGASGTAGTESHDDTRIGANSSLSNYANIENARLVLWDDGTTFEQAQEWVKRRYPNVNAYGKGR